MSQQKLLPFIEINPDKKALGSVILLHGLGADGNDFVPIVSELNILDNTPLRFVFPSAPHRAVTVNGGYVMPAWYDIISLSHDSHADIQGIDESVQQLNALIENEIKLGIPSDKIVVAGFSQGCVIALSSGITYPKKLAGILALSGYLPHAKEFLKNKHDANQKTPIFMAHGTQDTVLPFTMGQVAYNVLRENNFNVSFHAYPVAHTVSIEEIHDIAKWLKEIFKH